MYKEPVLKELSSDLTYRITQLQSLVMSSDNADLARVYLADLKALENSVDDALIDQEIDANEKMSVSEYSLICGGSLIQDSAAEYSPNPLVRRVVLRVLEAWIERFIAENNLSGLMPDSNLVETEESA